MKNKNLGGRPTIGDKAQVKKNIWLMPSDWERLKKIGGNYSAGVRKLLEGVKK